MINKDQDDVFSESQINKLKVAFKELDSNMGVNSFDQGVQLKILLSRLQQRRQKTTEGEEIDGITEQGGLGHTGLTPQLESRSPRGNVDGATQLHNISMSSSGQTNGTYRSDTFGVVQSIFSLLKSLVPSPKLALALAFVLGVALTNTYHLIADQTHTDSQTVRSRTSETGHPARIIEASDVIMLDQNSVEKRSQLIESAMRAKLSVSVYTRDSSIVLSVEGLKEGERTQLAFKALAGILPSQAGAVNFVFSR